MLSNEVQAVAEFFVKERFAYTQRPYTAADVARLRGNLQVVPASSFMAEKLYNLCRRKFAKGEFTHTFGALDTVQVAQMAKYLETVYVSGWQCSSTASSTNEPGPDFADYPSNTVPNKVDQLFRAQLFHDRKQREALSRVKEEKGVKAVDFLRPIIADGDTGFGGVTSVMKLMKLQIQAGAAGVHIEDQRAGTKKCGHMGGKVLVSVREHIDRLVAARLQADIMGAETVLIARTDASAATFIDSNVDPRDHPFISGCTNPDLLPLNQVLDEALAKGASQQEVDAITQKWLAEANLKRYPDVIANAIRASTRLTPAQKEQTLKTWIEGSRGSHSEARKLAAKLGFETVFWCWEKPRTREGYYRVLGGTDYCIARAIAFAPHADLIWMETATPKLDECIEFAKGVHAKVPHQMLAYNLSPSFNWDAAGMTDAKIADFQAALGKLGFVWHFVTLAGFHADSLVIDNFAKAYSKTGVIAYVKMIQRQEREFGVETLQHQKWSGAELLDAEMMTVTGGASSTASMGHGVTEKQFAAKL